VQFNDNLLVGKAYTGLLNLKGTSNNQQFAGSLRA
jgi:hypothetical protein